MPGSGARHLQEIPEESFTDIAEPLGEVVTDQQGRFARGGGPSGGGSGMSAGENHQLKTEMERRHLNELVKRIDAAVSASPFDRWVLVAPQSIAGRITDALSAGTREKLSETIPGDLVKLPLEKLEARLLGKH